MPDRTWVPSIGPPSSPPTHVVVPLGPDLFSLKGLQNLGPTLREWRRGWQERLRKRPEAMALPEGRMQPIGYVVMQHSVRLDRPAWAHTAAGVAQSLWERRPGAISIAVRTDVEGAGVLLATGHPEPSQMKRFGFLAEQIEVPDEFNTMGAKEIQKLFDGSSA